MKTLPSQACLLIDPKRITWGLRQAVPESVSVIEAINPTTLAKSCKTDAEAGFIRSHGARWRGHGRVLCLVRTRLGPQFISEITVDEKLTAAREQPGYVSLSFPTIAGFNANGALPHYRATPQAHAIISTAEGLTAQGLLLIDSGAQYLGGTTDITRVWAIGEPSAQQSATSRSY